MKNEYFGSKSILSLNSIEQGILLKFIESLGVVEKADNNFSIHELKDSVNLYDKSTSTTIIFNNFNLKQVNKVMIDCVGNYVYNRYKQERTSTMYNIFSLLSNGRFTVKLIDGMTLVDNRMSNISLNEYMFDTGMLFIISKVHEANYKNYHLVINDVIRAREYANKPTVVFFYGTKKEAKDLDYMFISPRELNYKKTSSTITYKDKEESTEVEEVNFLENDALFEEVL